MKMNNLCKSSSVRVLLYLLEKHSPEGSARYTQLLNSVGLSRGGLAIALKDLELEKMVERRVKPTKPIQTLYSLTEKGVEISEHLMAIRRLIQ
jgi:DNA-binding HxlR family transcriptional regulator